MSDHDYNDSYKTNLKYTGVELIEKKNRAIYNLSFSYMNTNKNTNKYFV